MPGNIASHTYNLYTPWPYTASKLYHSVNLLYVRISNSRYTPFVFVVVIVRRVNSAIRKWRFISRDMVNARVSWKISRTLARHIVM